jgi:membrane protease YdiL (CAAX protease family)
VALELSLALVALLLGRWWGIDLAGELIHLGPAAALRAAAVGAAATLPMLALFVALEGSSAAPLQQIRDWLRAVLKEFFPQATLLQLLAVALAAGWGEELLFRGLIQQGLARALADFGGGHGLALGGASLLFGMAHSVTRTYLLIATVIGAYLGILLWLTGSLWAPIVTHALYDFIVLWYLCRPRTALRQ